MDCKKTAELFKALGDEKRLYILSLLASDKLNATALLSRLNIGQPTLSHHMKILCACGLAGSVRHGRNTLYTLSPLGQAALAAAKNGLGFEAQTEPSIQPAIHASAKRGVRL